MFIEMYTKLAFYLLTMEDHCDIKKIHFNNTSMQQCKCVLGWELFYIKDFYA